jgi:signal transduction histidine kinase
MRRAMRLHRRHREHPPPWWPANEPWPPAGRVHAWRRGRSRFLRRIAGVFAIVLLLSAIGAATLLSLLLGRAGVVVQSPQVLWFAVIAATTVIIVLAAFSVAMRRVGLPLGDVVAAADRVASGDYSARVIEQGPLFLRSVARAFNSMTARLQAQDQQRRHLMADIAHELRTPLTVIQGRLEGLLDGVYPRDETRLSQVLDDTRILARLVEDLRTLANAESGALTLRKEPTDLAVLIHETATAFAAEAHARHVAVRVEDRKELPLVEVDPVRIREVLTNLLSNALRHTGGGGVVSVAAEVADTREKTPGSRDTQVVVKVTDTGSGIPADDLPKIFDRFYKGRSSQDAHGSGLGLTIARNLIVAHGGEIGAESREGHGTTMTFSLPLS